MAKKPWEWGRMAGVNSGPWDIASGCETPSLDENRLKKTIASVKLLEADEMD